MIKGKLLIGGSFVEGRSGRQFNSMDPSNGEVLGSMPYATVEEVQEAIGAAEAAFKGWASLTAAARAQHLQNAAAALLAHREELGELVTREEGKPRSEGVREVDSAAQYFQWYAEEAKRVLGEILPSPQAGRQLYVTKEPIGVTMVITPWNYPVSILGRKLAPALAAGCTVVLKPAEDTPLCALRFMEILHESGMPPGVINLISGKPSEISDAMLKDPRVRKISLTGSTEVGRLVMRAAAENIVSVALELGGNSPLIVFDDADLDKAVAGIMAGKFRNMGEICIAVNRVLVQRSVYEAVTERVAEATRALKIGHGLNEGTQIGPLINQKAIAKVREHIADAVAQGAKVLVGGDTLTDGDYAQGTWFAPTVLADVRPGMRILNEETFGPVAPLTVFDTEQEAVEMANNTPFGLSAYFYTRDLGRAMRVSRALEFGIVGCNDATPTLVEAPLGGVKLSGLGREGGHQGIDEFLEIKYTSVKY